jgi:DDE superfamily endonuclease
LEQQGQKIKLVFFDEFSCSQRPNPSYAWAKVNTRPQVKSNERLRDRLNGLLAVEVTTGREYLKLTKQAKTEDIVEYFYELVTDSSKQGYTQIWIILDNNPTHKGKMKRLLRQRLQQGTRNKDTRTTTRNTTRNTTAKAGM